MQREYRNMYLRLARHHPLPKQIETFSNCSTKVGNTITIQGQSNLVDQPSSKGSKNISPQRAHSQLRLLNFERPTLEHRSPRRIHNNYSHFSAYALAKAGSQSIDHQQQIHPSTLQTLQHKSNPTIIGKRKDLYDDHIEKYMSTKYDKSEFIEKYLADREALIKEACQQIQKDIKEEYHLNKKPNNRANSKQHLDLLPKIDLPYAMMLKKSVNQPKNGVYLQQLGQIKKSEQLYIKEQRRRQRDFRRRMSSLETRLSKLSIIDIC